MDDESSNLVLFLDRRITSPHPQISSDHAICETLTPATCLYNPTLRQLQHALINVGFLYLFNPPVAREDIDAVIAYCPRLFDIPQDAKEKVRMVNSPHFFGYTKFGSEITKGQADQREQYDFGTPYENKWQPGEPEYLKLWGPAQWPDENIVPEFKETYLRYLAQIEVLSFEFIRLIEEALELPSRALDKFQGESGPLQHRAKVIKYPAPPDSSSNQGVGPHFDGGFLTFLLQASAHRGLQVQNLAGEWIDAPPIPGTFVVNIGKALETVTQGLAKATSHRVLSPEPGSSPRYSIPFFQNISQDIRIGESVLSFSPEILKLKEARGEPAATDSVNYAEYGQLPSGEVALRGRVSVIIWDYTKWVTIPLAVMSCGQFFFSIYAGTANAVAFWDIPLRSCMFEYEHYQHMASVLLYTTVYDFIILIFTCVNVVSAIIIWLHLNDGMDAVVSPPATAISVILSSQSVISLLRSDSSSGADTPNSNRRQDGDRDSKYNAQQLTTQIDFPVSIYGPNSIELARSANASQSRLSSVVRLGEGGVTRAYEWWDTHVPAEALSSACGK
ncbi:hypothetical protein EUX98_g2783 [Antrodiella citrinella]|uniref:Fe2OG dioxygenase domain-containing protein n=1 Tax=Antrodiella citrinella TaxID=2447956 RepID=A0A4S4MY70_9APHY|nr:hypothetical protein EUX98_g2783 [Antrodiella citrinella]